MRGCAQVRLHRLVAGEDLVRFFVRDCAGDDHVLALLPVCWPRHLVLCRQLHGIEHTDDLIEVPASGHRIGQRQLDLLVGTDHEDRPHRRVVGGGTAFAAVACIGGEHVVQLGNLQLWIADDRIVNC